MHCFWVDWYWPLTFPGRSVLAARNQVNVAAFRDGRYPINRSLFVVIKANGQADEQAGDADGNLVLTAAGQGLVEAAGLVQVQ